MGLIDRIRSGDYVPDGPPVAAAGRVRSLHEQADRIRAGDDVLDVVRDVLDQLGRASDPEVDAAVLMRPEPTGDARADALLAAVVEHLASRRGLDTPVWVGDADRFLDRFWFVSEIAGFRAIAVAQTPISLRRRGILWTERSLRRV